MISHFLGVPAIAWLALTLSLPFATTSADAGQAGPAPAAVQSAQHSLEYLRRVMDEYHDRFPVYDDISSPGNHFHAWAKIPTASAPVDVNGSWTDSPHSGATSIRCAYAPIPGVPSFGGFYFQNGTLQGDERAPQPNFGAVPNAGINLTGATALTFWVRGAVGGEQIEFFMAGVGRDADSGLPLPTSPFPDSSPRRPARGTLSMLTTAWQQVRIDLTGMDLSYVLGGLGWVADSQHNPGGAVFFLDDIQFELGPTRRGQRLNEPRFLRSFTLLPTQPDPFDAVSDGDIDFVLRNLAFAYDNALALLAFLGDRSDDSLRRARLIGDAFVYSMQHDRTYNDNRTCAQAVDPLSPDGARMRTALSAGDLWLPPGWAPKGRVGTVPIPGFYAEATKTFYEVEQQALDVGNNLWVAIALTSLYQRTGQASYLDAACKLGNFVHALRNDTGAFQGFTGGIDAPEGTAARRMWASSEHNLDAHAAFSALHTVTGEARWQQDASHAAAFVEAMWSTDHGCYLAGTRDPNTKNTSPDNFAVDVQAWSVLALPAPPPHLSAIDCIVANHVNTSDGLTGVDFNNDRDGVWPEGTAQTAVAAMRAGRVDMADSLRAQLRLAQQTAPFGDGFGIAASSHDGLSTGFLTAGGQPFKYFRRLHIGASAWNVFGQLSLNPYYSHRLTVNVSGLGGVSAPSLDPCTATCASVWMNGALVALTAMPQAGWRFEGWTGVCAESGAQCVVPMAAARTVEALFLPATDPSTDGDNLPTWWEQQFGLDAASAAGNNGDGGDPDGDGRTNQQEFQAGTHPRGFFVRYLAEGAANAFFDLRFALLNVGASEARLLRRYLPSGGAVVTQFDRLPARRRRTLTKADLVDLNSADFSTVVESDQPFVLDRTMSWGGGYGSHAESGVPRPSTIWYFAEGSTSGPFALFYLLQNPSAVPTVATVKYLLPLGQAPITRQYTVLPNSRKTIPVDDEGSELANTDVSAEITATSPIIVERAMYRTSPTQPFAAGHGSAGVTAPARDWFLAEGATGPFFDCFVLLANPQSVPATATVHYLLSDGRTFSKAYTVPAQGRLTVWVDNEELPSGSGLRPLDNVAVSSTVNADQEIVVERTMWWPGPQTSPDYWTEAHNSPGATSTGASWAMAEGEVGGAVDTETYILIANTSTAAGTARVTLYFEDGSTVQRDFQLLPRSRRNVRVSTEFPQAANRRFGSLVESIGATPAQIVVERAMYTSPGGLTWAAGTNALATPLP